MIQPSRASGQPATHDKESHGNDHGKFCQGVQVRYAHAHESGVSGVGDPDVAEYEHKSGFLHSSEHVDFQPNQHHTYHEFQAMCKLFGNDASQQQDQRTEDQ